MEKKVESRRTGIFSVESSRDLAENAINDGVESGGGRLGMSDSTPERFVEGAFPPGDPNRRFEAPLLVTTRIINHEDVSCWDARAWLRFVKSEDVDALYVARVDIDARRPDSGYVVSFDSGGDRVY